MDHRWRTHRVDVLHAVGFPHHPAHGGRVGSYRHRFVDELLRTSRAATLSGVVRGALGRRSVVDRLSGIGSSLRPVGMVERTLLLRERVLAGRRQGLRRIVRPGQSTPTLVEPVARGAGVPRVPGSGSLHDEGPSRSTGGVAALRRALVVGGRRIRSRCVLHRSPAALERIAGPVGSVRRFVVRVLRHRGARSRVLVGCGLRRAVVGVEDGPANHRHLAQAGVRGGVVASSGVRLLGVVEGRLAQRVGRPLLSVGRTGERSRHPGSHHVLHRQRGYVSLLVVAADRSGRPHDVHHLFGSLAGLLVVGVATARPVVPAVANPRNRLGARRPVLVVLSEDRHHARDRHGDLPTHRGPRASPCAVGRATAVRVVGRDRTRRRRGGDRWS